MEKYILGIDAGTTSVRAGLYNIEQNKLEYICQQPIEIFCPHDGWVEQDGEKIFEAVQKVIDNVINENNVDVTKILALSITNQRETTVAWNKTTGESIYPVINWQCRRTKETIDNMSDTQKHNIKKITGLIPDAYFSATKMVWFQENIEKVQQLQQENNLCFGTIDTFLIYKLTQGKTFVTDVTNASRTMLMDLKTCDWNEYCLKHFNIDRKFLPDIVCNDEVVGFAEIQGCHIPICGVVGDQQSALFGQMCFGIGDVKNTYGTGCFMLVNTGDKVVESQTLVSTVGYKLKGQNTVYALEGSCFNAGSCVELIKDLGLIENSAQSQELAQEVEDSGKIVFVPALTGLGAPYWNMQARGMFIGLTRSTKKQHLVRAVLESIAFSCLDVLLEMRQGVGQIKCIKCDGGVSKNDFLMQFQSDIAKTELVVPAEYEKTLMGCIYLALCGLKLTTPEKLLQSYKENKRFKPNMDIETIKRKYKRWKRAVIRSLDWVE